MSEYIHGSDPVEQARLTAMNEAINASCLSHVEIPAAGRVLDLGSGLGQFSRAMAKKAGAGSVVVAVERDGAQLAEACRQAEAAGESNLVDFRAGDALQPPLRDDEWGSFDVAHTRFLLEHLTNPIDAVRVMVRAVRPGGRVVLLDDDHDLLRLWPEPPGLAAVWAAYVRSYDRLGNEPYAGRRLVEYLHRAGAKPARNDWVFFGACTGSPRFELLVSNLQHVLLGAIPTLERFDLSTRLEVEAAVAVLGEWKALPDAAIWYAIAIAEGVKP